MSLSHVFAHHALSVRYSSRACHLLRLSIHCLNEHCPFHRFIFTFHFSFRLGLVLVCVVSRHQLDCHCRRLLYLFSEAIPSLLVRLSSVSHRASWADSPPPAVALRIDDASQAWRFWRLSLCPFVLPPRFIPPVILTSGDCV